ncbi:hypothetical protein SABIM44S_00190 [Streptomyces abikoensis]
MARDPMAGQALTGIGQGRIDTSLRITEADVRLHTAVVDNLPVSHEISIFALHRVGPEDGVHPDLHGEIRPLINGEDVLEEVFPEGTTLWWQWGGDGIPLAASEAGTRVMMAAAECSTSCCGSIWVTIRREGPHVLWEGWENSGDGGKVPPEFRFDAARYDAELARATAAWG